MCQPAQNVSRLNTIHGQKRAEGWAVRPHSRSGLWGAVRKSGGWTRYLGCMSESPGSSKSPSFSLTDELQATIEGLATAATPHRVAERLLDFALPAFQALGGAVLTVDDVRQHLEMVGRQGYPAGDPLFWQAGPLDEATPVTDVLRSGEALFFEHAGVLTAAYPDLERRTGVPAAVAAAVLPLVLDGRALGTLILEFREPHAFGWEERSLLKTLAAHCAAALHRIQTVQHLERQAEQRVRELTQEMRAQEAFMAFSEAIGSQTDVVALTRQAIEVLRVRFPTSSVAYYEEEGPLWKARAWSDDLSAEMVTRITAGVASELPMIVRIKQSPGGLFADSWELDAERTDRNPDYGVVAGFPLRVNGESKWLLAIGLKGAKQWTESDRAVVRAVGRGLNMAMERTATARRLEQQNAELIAQTNALTAFADLTHELSLTTDPYLLVRRAQEVVLSMLADGAAMYYETDGTTWWCLVQHGTLRSADLQAAIDQGLPYHQANNLLRPWTTGKPYFQEVYDHQTDGVSGSAEHIAATATLPVMVDGRVAGVLAIALFNQRRWSVTDRAVLETVTRSLGLAMERVQSLTQLTTRNTQLETERAALDAFARFTELVGSETEVPQLVRQAMHVLQETCGVDVTYVERNGELFEATSWSDGYDPVLLERLRQGFPLRYSSIALVLKENTAAFMDDWNDTVQWLEESALFGAVAGYPYFLDDELERVLIMGSRTGSRWSARDQGIFRAVGRSLGLALDRAEQARQVREKNIELAARTQALEAFAALSVDFTLDSDVDTLVRQAQEVALSLLPRGVALYYEPDGTRWRSRVQVGRMDTPALQAMVDAGLPMEEAQSLIVPWRTGKAYYQTAYDGFADTFGPAAARVGASATLPVVVGGSPVGVLALGLFQTNEWSAAQRVMLETIVRSLSLAMEGSRSLRQLAARSLELEDERAALSVFTAFTEQVATETDVLRLCARAFEVMDVHFRAYSSIYCEVRDGRWQGLAWTGDLSPSQVEMIQTGLPLDFPTFSKALSSRQPDFIDGWNGTGAGVPETEDVGPVCIYPLVAEEAGQVVGVLIVGLRAGKHWQDRDRAMMVALGRSLSLTLERTEQTRQLTRQRDLLDARTQLLSMANEDMEAFTYSVSHDLRTPVRHIYSFNDLLRRSLGPDLKPESDRYLTVVSEAALRMNALIDAMLDLSRSSQRPLSSRPVDLNDLGRQVILDLEPEPSERLVQWSVSALPTVQGDRETLRQVLSNLLANSLKYTGTRPEARIELWAEDRGEHWAILIRDNGVGFDPKYQHQLFGVFKRLHHQRDFEGTGVGLATVKRIVLKHGGEVFAEGRPDEGATFGFTLPKRPPLHA